MASDESDAMFYIENGFCSDVPWWVDNHYIDYDDYTDDYEYSTKKKRAVVFIDAENISSYEFDNKYKKKIKKFAKNRKIIFEDVEIRAYAVEGGPTSNSWKSEGVTIKKIPGKPATNKTDNQIIKEINDQANTEKICMLVTHDKKLQSKASNLSNRVYIFDE